jgi:hypothetical protein
MVADGGAVMGTRMLFRVPESLVNIAHLPKLNGSSSVACDWTACVAPAIAGAARHHGPRWAAVAAQMKEAPTEAALLSGADFFFR